MISTSIIIFFAIFITLAAVFMLMVKRQKQRKKSNGKENLYAGEDITDPFFRHLDDL